MQNLDKSNISECFVGFVDILGFSDLIKQDHGTGSYLQIIKTSITRGTRIIKERIKDLNSPENDYSRQFKINCFSDCFCFSFPISFENNKLDYQNNFVSFCLYINEFYNALLNEGLLCRGGISQGWHYSDEDFIFSEALINAYHIESKFATHPIIVLDKVILEHIKCIGFENEKYMQYLFAHDIGGRTFLNPFNSELVEEMFFLNNSEFSKKAKANKKNTLDRYLDVLSIKIDKYNGDIAIDKYIWLKDYISCISERYNHDKFGYGVFHNKLSS